MWDYVCYYGCMHLSPAYICFWAYLVKAEKDGYLNEHIDCCLRRIKANRGLQEKFDQSSVSMVSDLNWQSLISSSLLWRRRSRRRRRIGVFHIHVSLEDCEDRSRSRPLWRKWSGVLPRLPSGGFSSCGDHTLSVIAEYWLRMVLRFHAFIPTFDQVVHLFSVFFLYVRIALTCPLALQNRMKLLNTAVLGLFRVHKWLYTQKDIKYTATVTYRNCRVSEVKARR